MHHLGKNWGLFHTSFWLLAHSSAWLRWPVLSQAPAKDTALPGERWVPLLDFCVSHSFSWARNFRQRLSKSQSGMMRLLASLVPFVFHWTVGQLTQGSLHKDFDHFLCLFIIVFPLRIAETVIKHRNNSCSFFFEISITFLGSNCFIAFIPEVRTADLHRALHINCALQLLVEIIFCFQHRPVAPLGKTSKLQPQGRARSNKILWEPQNKSE